MQKGGLTRARPFVMSSTHWLISGFIAFHLLSIVVGSTPDPATLNRSSAPDRAVLTPLGRALAPVLDATTGPIRAADATLWRATAWCQPAVRLYLRVTRQYQRWNMFSRPFRKHEYIHLRYYIATGGSSLLRVQRELIYPGHTGANVRLLKSFADSFRDKAMGLALDAHAQRVRRERKNHDVGTALERSQEELIPIIRPFARHQADALLVGGDRLVRAELWRGTAPMPRPGQVLPSDTYQARQETLASYDAVSELGLIASTDLAPLGVVTYDADIEWTLLAQVTWK
jgi:hypothetical protein